MERGRIRQLLPTGPSTACPSTEQVDAGVNIQSQSREDEVTHLSKLFR